MPGHDVESPCYTDRLSLRQNVPQLVCDCGRRRIDIVQQLLCACAWRRLELLARELHHLGAQLGVVHRIRKRLAQLGRALWRHPGRAEERFVESERAE